MRQAEDRESQIPRPVPAKNAGRGNRAGFFLAKGRASPLISIGVMVVRDIDKPPMKK